MLPDVATRRFSERNGLTRPRELELEAAGKSLRVRVWNELETSYFSNVRIDWRKAGDNDRYWVEFLWDQFFKLPIVDAPQYRGELMRSVQRFLMECKWFEFFDFMEYVANSNPVFPIGSFTRNDMWTASCNSILEAEFSGYRFIGKEVVPITNVEEVETIRSAQDAALSSVGEHITAAVHLLSDREKPDYRNSIKESISAVEAACRSVSPTKAMTLGDALKILERETALNPVLRSGFEKLYAFTNGKEGIRHALMDEPSVTFTEAKFMLVACSAFSNFIIERTPR